MAAQLNLSNILQIHTRLSRVHHDILMATGFDELLAALNNAPSTLQAFHEVAMDLFSLDEAIRQLSLRVQQADAPLALELQPMVNTLQSHLQRQSQRLESLI
jgi:hypothetical protein